MRVSSKAGKKNLNGPKDDDKGLVDPLAGLAEGYDGDDELMLEALGMKPAPQAPPPTRPPAVAPAAAPAQSPPGAMPPDVLNAILAAIPDAVRSAINEKDLADNSSRPSSPPSAMGQGDVQDGANRPLAEVRDESNPMPSQTDEPTPEFELAPELAAFMEEEPKPGAGQEVEEAGIEIASEEPEGATEPEMDGAKLQGLLGRIRGKPASEIARGATGAGPRAAASQSPAGPGIIPPVAAKQISNLKLQLETAKAEVEKARKNLAQIQAETVTFRKRLGEQVKEGNLSGREDVFKAVITVFDSIASALASSKDSRDFDTLYAGVEMIERQFHQVLKPLGLISVDALGEKFDPSHHEAMQMTSTGKGAPGTVFEQIRKGYRTGEKLIRPALVVVEAQPAATDSDS